MASLVVALNFFVILLTICNAVPINIHSCRLEKKRLMCEWQGHGKYVADRPLYGIEVIVFDRFFGSRRSSIDLRSNTPNLNKLLIKSGDVECEDLLVNPGVVVYINDQRPCSLDGASPSPTRNMDHLTPVTVDDHATEKQDKTTVKLQVETAKSNHLPIISITWEALDRVEVLIILILVLLLLLSLTFTSIGIYVAIRRLRKKVHQGHSADDFELFDRGVASQQPSQFSSIPTYNFDEFVSSTHLKES